MKLLHPKFDSLGNYCPIWQTRCIIKVTSASRECTKLILLLPNYWRSSLIQMRFLVFLVCLYYVLNRFHWQLIILFSVFMKTLQYSWKSFIAVFTTRYNLLWWKMAQIIENNMYLFNWQRIINWEDQFSYLY